MLEWLHQATHVDGISLTLGELIVRLIIAFGFGCLTAGVHYLTSAPSRKADRSLLATLVLLAVLIAVVTIVVGNNVARAFSLAGVLAIVRFRTVVDDTRDTAFVIYAVVAGMAAGGGYYWEPAIATPMVFLAAWIFRPLPAIRPPNRGMLTLRLTAGRPTDSTIEEALKRHLKEFHLVGMSTARGGSAVDITYTISFPTADKVFPLIQELGRIEGVQNVEVKEG